MGKRGRKSGFVCLGKRDGWCKKVHNTMQGAVKCCLQHDNKMLSENNRQTDREVYAVKDPIVGKRTTRIYFLRDGDKITKMRSEAFTRVRYEIEEQEHSDELKVLMFVFKSYAAYEDTIGENIGISMERVSTISTLLENKGLLVDIGEDGSRCWQSHSTHDMAEWDDIKSELEATWE